MKSDFIDLAKVGGSAGRGDDQWGWYGVFKPYMSNCSVLDVGTGISKIKERTAGWGSVITTHEACPDCIADIHGDISGIPSKSYDTVTCFDVIEHVKDYGRFAFNLARIATKHVVITTPGFLVTGCTNPYHWHEFGADEFRNLMEATGLVMVEAYGSAWESYPDKALEFRRFTYNEICDNFPLHPIGVVFKHEYQRT